MEPFFDGGMIELFVVLTLALAINFIFVRKYLLIAYSLLTVACPVLLFFFRTGEIFYWLAAACIANAVLLVILLWKEKNASPQKTLFSVDEMKAKLKNPLKAWRSKRTVQSEPPLK